MDHDGGSPAGAGGKAVLMKEKRFDGYARQGAREFERLQAAFGFWNAGVHTRKFYFQLLRLQRDLVPKPHVECRVETKQQFQDFSLDDVIHFLEKLGDMANLLYPISHTFNVGFYSDSSGMDHSGLNDLQKEGINELKRIVWIVASFSNRLKKDPSHVSLVERLKELQKKNGGVQC
jgi:hypothetical protein